MPYKYGIRDFLAEVKLVIWAIARRWVWNYAGRK